MASYISIIKVFNGAAMLQAASISEIVDLSRFNCEGFFSLQIDLAGAGNVNVVWSASNDGSIYITPSGTSNLYTAFGAASGEGSDGHSIVSFDPLLSKFIKFTATEQNAGAITSISCHLAIQ